jgi:hypothetical protein
LRALPTLSRAMPVSLPRCRGPYRLEEEGKPMRTIHALPLLAAFALAACGGGTADEDGDGKVSNQEAAAAADSMIKPEPGQYKTSLEMLEFDIPGMTDEMKTQMRTMMGGELAKGNTFCLTPEEAASQGPQQMVENMAESNCSFAKFDVAGGNISADMQCTGEDGKASHVLMDGQMSSTGSNMTMTMDQDQGAVGKVHMKMRVISERTGDCA